jgi:hypothetical protein
MEKENIAKKCVEEVDEILKKYNCRIIVEQRDYYGQTVFVPVFVELKPEK